MVKFPECSQEIVIGKKKLLAGICLLIKLFQDRKICFKVRMVNFFYNNARVSFLCDLMAETSTLLCYHTVIIGFQTMYLLM